MSVKCAIDRPDAPAYMIFSSFDSRSKRFWGVCEANKGGKEVFISHEEKDVRSYFTALVEQRNMDPEWTPPEALPGYFMKDWVALARELALAVPYGHPILEKYTQMEKTLLK